MCYLTGVPFFYFFRFFIFIFVVCFGYNDGNVVRIELTLLQPFPFDKTARKLMNKNVIMINFIVSMKNWITLPRIKTINDVFDKVNLDDSKKDLKTRLSNGV